MAANLLVDAGWSVEVLEAQQEPGGAVRSDRGVHPDYISDVFSAFYPSAAASPVLARLDLEAEGLRWSTPRPYWPTRCWTAGARCWSVGCRTPAPAWPALRLPTPTPTPGRTRTGRGPGWGRTSCKPCSRPSPRSAPGSGWPRNSAPPGGLRPARKLALPVRRLGEEEFTGDGGRLLLAGNALPADLAPEAAGSGGFGWLMSMLGQSHGFPVPVGGAGALTAALVSRLRRRGGVLRCGERVASVVVRGGTAVGVRTAGGETVSARRAVLADTSAPALYRDLVGEEHLPSRLLRDLDRFQWDFATSKVDWALTGPVPWTAPQATGAGTVHVADGVDGLTRFAAQIAMGQVPDEPFALFGQMTTADPTRSPAGTESAWAYTHLPQHITSDAGPDHITGRWDAREQEAMADRVEAQVERFAPGFRGLIGARRILAPTTLQAMNENLHNGATDNGTTALHQQAVFRPTPGTGRPETPVRRLYFASAAAHPGGGVHGAPGANAARSALRAHGVRALLHRAQRV
ncbi:phytoene desaturase family protein [Streptomyces sp. NPDC002587]